VKVHPRDLDMASDLRRFWWLIPPLLIAFVAFAGLRITGFGDEGPSTLPSQSRTTSSHYTLASSPALHVRSFAGDVRIEAASGRQVSVTVRSRGVDADHAAASRELAAIHTDIVRVGDDLHVSVMFNGPRANDASGADIVIRAPADSSVDVDTGHGAVSAIGILGEIRVRSHGGNILVRLPVGRQIRYDGSGALHSEFPAADADNPEAQSLYLDSASGNVSIMRQ
jgi:hypothetical protein